MDFGFSTTRTAVIQDFKMPDPSNIKNNFLNGEEVIPIDFTIKFEESAHKSMNAKYWTRIGSN